MAVALATGGVTLILRDQITPGLLALATGAGATAWAVQHARAVARNRRHL